MSSGIGISGKWVFGAIAAAALMFGAANANAVTVIDNGDSVIIGPGGDTEFIGNVTSSGGAGMWQVEFSAGADPLFSTASATIGNIVAGTFTNLVMQWIAVSDGVVLASAPIVVPVTTLSTTFTDNGMMGRDDNPQYLKISWDDSLFGAGFDVEVSAVPLPAGGLLLLTALGGVAALRRRRKAA